MRQKLMDFMRGRNGTDQLSMCMMWAACILVFIDMFVRSNILSTIAFVTFAFAYFRVFSRNIGKRRDENTWFLNKTYKLRMWGRKERNHIRCVRRITSTVARSVSRKFVSQREKERSRYVVRSVAHGL